MSFWPRAFFGQNYFAAGYFGPRKPAVEYRFFSSYSGRWRWGDEDVAEKARRRVKQLARNKERRKALTALDLVSTTLDKIGQGYLAEAERLAALLKEVAEAKTRAVALALVAAREAKAIRDKLEDEELSAAMLLDVPARFAHDNENDDDIAVWLLLAA